MKSGDRIELIFMEDKFPIDPGTKGTVKSIDDSGLIHMNWDDGSTLAIVPEVDKYKKIEE